MLKEKLPLSQKEDISTPKKNGVILHGNPTPSSLLSKIKVTEKSKTWCGGNRKKKHLVSGFTFIESLVAISFVMVGVAVAVTMIRVDLLVSSVTKNAVVARFLAQEAVEYVRNVRDSHIVDFDKTSDPTIEWLGTLESCSGGTSCYIDTTDPLSVVVISCGAGGCPVLNYNETLGCYGYDSGVLWKETPFVREIEITDPNGGSLDSEAVVTVRVKWNERGVSDREVMYQQSLFNWIE